MNKTISTVAALLCAAMLFSLPGCAVVSHAESPTTYDLGAPQTRAGATLPVPPPVSIAGISAPAWLDSTSMYYRLNYANSQQPRPYAQARWSMPPAQLLQQQLKARIAQSGGAVLSTSDGIAGPVLRIELVDFSQNFRAPGQSSGEVGMRASVFKDRKLLAQKTLSAQAPAPSADASGGAKAMATASDAAISDLIRWLASLNLQ